MIRPRLNPLGRIGPLLAVMLTPWTFFSRIQAAAPVHSLSQPAAIIPQDLLYFTRLAGPGTEYAWDIAVDGAGNSYIAGMTDSAGLAGVANVHIVSPGGGFDAFVIKLTADGTMAYATRIGGSLLDQASRIAVDAAGNATIAGYTFSSDFPTTPGAYDRTYNGGDIDSFVARLSPDGTQLAYSTFLGGDSDDYGGGITVDAAGQAFVTGYTESRNFPTSPGAFDATHNGVSDVFVVRLDATGATLVYSTFVGGSGIEIATIWPLIQTAMPTSPARPRPPASRPPRALSARSTTAVSPMPLSSKSPQMRVHWTTAPTSAGISLTMPEVSPLTGMETHSLPAAPILSTSRRRMALTMKGTMAAAMRS